MQFRDASARLPGRDPDAACGGLRDPAPRAHVANNGRKHWAELALWEHLPVRLPGQARARPADAQEARGG